MSTERPKALFIVAPGTSSNERPHGEVAVKTRLESLGYDVEEEVEGRAFDVRDKALVIVSSCVKDATVGAKLREVAVPIIASSMELYVSLGMCRAGDTGHESGHSEIVIIHPTHPGHSMMANMTGCVEIASTYPPSEICWTTTLPGKAVAIAALKWKPPQGESRPSGDHATDEPPKNVLFGCHMRSPMFGEDPQAKPKDFAARRVAFPIDYGKEQKGDALWPLFDEAVNWAVGRVNTRQFDEVFREEWQEIYKRRIKAYQQPAEKDLTGFDGKSAPENLVGLALSGGGIRSATFCLGVLQGLDDLKLLRIFDYLSTVSGGGYLGGWWSAWLSREGKDQDERIFPSPENIEPQRLELYRQRNDSAKVAEGSLSAGSDPIHHLRLFANYLTPRKGTLSSDTWRAITVLTRNLLLTWLMLLPLLFAVVIAAQSLFMMYQKQYFFYHYWANVQSTVRERATATSNTQEKDLKEFDQKTGDMLKELRSSYVGVLKQRAIFIVALLIPVVGWVVLMLIAFMRSNATGEGASAHSVGAVAVGVIGILVLLLLLRLSWPLSSSTVRGWPSQTIGWLGPRICWWVVGLVAWLIVGLLLWRLTKSALHEGGADAKTGGELRRDVWGNRISRIHARLLVTSVLLAVVLVFAAFGHEVFDYLWRDADPRNLFLAYVAKAGGWVTFALATFGTIFSAIKSAPSGGHDSGDVKPTPAWHQTIFKITPPLVLITLMIVTAWCAHEIARPLANRAEYPWPLSAIIVVGVFLALFFALYEVSRNTPRLGPSWLAGVFLGTAGGAIAVYFLLLRSRPLEHFVLSGFAALVGGVLFFRSRLKRDRWSAGWRCLRIPGLIKEPSQKTEDEQMRLQKPGAVRLVFLAILLVLMGWLFASSLGSTVSDRPGLTSAAFAGIALCLVYALLEAFFAKGDNTRFLALFVSAYFVSLMLLLISFHGDDTSRYPYVSLGLFVATVTWVIAFGWMADPNAISMHGFYKDRLVRAYLGASNPQRDREDYEITETVVGDDLHLTDLRNCERGAPYHLLNTTLNLTGGRDLATAQRSSAMFVLSKLYCGSFRTGFRRSKKYADGRLSLGMAVATSGAAVSPGMGAGKTTAAQAMLMTLLNLRLGFWAPTPGGKRWDSPQARLWPYYTLREFLSQTNDLSSYCYLTDGGHFDNLGLYSLVERGCRYIVAVDAVADSKPAFSDLGNAIRRCRIDFNTEIDLDITSFVKSKDEAFAKQHYAIGQIVYSEEHAGKLGWKDTALSARTGLIVYIKSSLLRNEKELRADVRQYGIENSDFPQQSTGDQWFDEAQFESYRQLGKHSALKVFNKLKTDPHKTKREQLTGPPPPTLSGDDRILLQELSEENEMIVARDGKALSPVLIKRLFDFTERNLR